MTDTGPPLIVKALFTFKGSNNDELCFSKGDIITVTQAIDGGWWEGTYDNKTGWFPSNYVKEAKPAEARQHVEAAANPDPVKTVKKDNTLFYHNVVIQSFIDSERTLVNELQTLIQTYITPLQSANIMSPIEFSKLCGNIEEIFAMHKSLLSSLEECANLGLTQQKVGGMFLAKVTQIQSLYEGYCKNHPQAVSVLQKYKDELSSFMETKGAPSPGIRKLTTMLSVPFARLEKYPALLKELVRHTEESHPDRGDTQRAISVYRDVCSGCAEMRRQKETEYEVMSSPIKGWEGEEISKLGEVLKMTMVRVESENGDKQEVLLLLFPGVLLLLSPSTNAGYTYQGKLPTTGLCITPVEDSEAYSHAFELVGSMVEKRVVHCSTDTERLTWMEILKQQAKNGPVYVPAKPQSLQVSTSQPSISTLSKAKVAQMSLQPYRPHQTTWTMSCLRPAPPMKFSHVSRTEVQRSPRGARKILGGTLRKKPVDAMKMQDFDSLILEVLDAYCTSTKTRHTVNSLDLSKLRITRPEHELHINHSASPSPALPPKTALLEHPSMLIAEEEKIIVEEMKGGVPTLEERTLVDTVYSLRDQVKELKKDQDDLKATINNEVKARKRLEGLIKTSRKSTSDQGSISITKELSGNTIP